MSDNQVVSWNTHTPEGDAVVVVSYEDFVRVRDELSAERESNKNLMEQTTSYLRQAREACEELSAERKRADEAEADAKRYRWLRMQHWYDGVISTVISPRNHLKPFATCPSERYLDIFIDEAMKNG